MGRTRPFTRAQILERLRGQIAAGRPVIGAGSSSGLIAKSAAAGGADLIIVYNTGRTRLMGLATSHLLNHANPTTLAMYAEIANVVVDRPIIGGAEAQDPCYLHDVDRLVDDFRATGFDGLINFPTTGPDPVRGAERESVGLGLPRDFEMVGIARDKDYFTICYGYTEEQTVGLAAAGCDVIVPHAGWTTGGLAGAGQSALSLEQACEHVQHLIELARREHPDVICLSHGGPLSGPADTRYLYEHTDAQGFLGASSVERIPVEAAVMDTVGALRSRRLRPEAVGA
ncbi:MAG TPA: phosphoenolpyruvate hydrolase family protein [Solirubrobacteraceae bacterium]|jgi:predicted TIM-barrel enzyme|nr:phosphoenolpyruvate hydrolase family protein [Solirubrobacteraceae bacterium]